MLMKSLAGNPVGSLTEEQHAIVIGSLLGDGSMRCKANALLEINHCLTQQGYVDWKHQRLANLVNTPPKSRKGNGRRTAYRFVTRSLPVLTPYHELFYGAGAKRVPDVELSPLALAVWFMDDGSRSRNAVYLNTQQFAVGCQRRLLKMLRKQWGIKGSLNRDKHYHRIYIAVESVPRLAEIIRPHLLPAFEYKLPQTP